MLKQLKTDHLDILKIHDVQTVADVAKLSEKDGLIEIIKLKEMALQLSPFYRHENLPRMKPGYCDRDWA